MFLVFCLFISFFSWVVLFFLAITIVAEDNTEWLISSRNKDGTMSRYPFWSMQMLCTLLDMYMKMGKRFQFLLWVVFLCFYRIGRETIFMERRINHKEQVIIIYSHKSTGNQYWRKNENGCWWISFKRDTYWRKECFIECSRSCTKNSGIVFFLFLL